MSRSLLIVGDRDHCLNRVWTQGKGVLRGEQNAGSEQLVGLEFSSAKDPRDGVGIRTLGAKSGAIAMVCILNFISSRLLPLHSLSRCSFLPSSQVCSSLPSTQFL